MDFMQMLSLFLLFISLILIIWMIITFRKVRNVSPRDCFLSIIISILILVVYWILLGTSLSIQLIFFSILFGTILGIWRGSGTNVWREGGKGKVQSTVWYLVIWAICYFFTQFLISIGNVMSYDVGLSVMLFGTGVVLGSQGNILYRLLEIPVETTDEAKEVNQYN